MTTTQRELLHRIESRGLAGSLLVFGIEQAWAALFGGLMLLGLVLTRLAPVSNGVRYDLLFGWAVLVQAGMLLARLERPYEVVTVVFFHLVGLGMELFKTAPGVGSWAYPGVEDAVFTTATVPLFSGFMYAAVGSYIARSWRVLELRYTGSPPIVLTVVLAAAIYGNFFLNATGVDVRLALFVVAALLWRRTWVFYRLNRRERRMPLLLGFVLIALFIWIAENVATFTGTWLYPSQVAAWHPVGLEKLGSWFLLLLISFVSVDVLEAVRRRMRLRRARGKPRQAASSADGS